MPVATISSMYDSANKRAKLYTFTASSATVRTYSATGYREPDIVTDYDNTASNYANNGVKKNGTSSDIASGAEFKEQLQIEFETMIESVDKYGGFYIGRYETGSGYVVQENKAPQVSTNWYTFYQKQKEMYASSGSVISSMLYGAQWDQALLWFYNGTAEEKLYVTNSAGKGNYSGSADGYSGVAPTGKTSGADVKNIYDMAGNVYDWTQEAFYTSGRVGRGR